VTKESQKSAIGEMRRRHEEIIRSGVLSKLRSEGRMVLTLALCWADYKTCQFRMSASGASRTAGVQRTAVRRGLRQLLEHGVIEEGPKENGKRQRYRFCPNQLAPPVPPPGTPGASALAHPVPPPGTPGATSRHPPCQHMAPPVPSSGTVCATYSSIVLKGSSRTLDDSARSGPIGPPVHSEPNASATAGGPA